MVEHKSGMDGQAEKFASFANQSFTWLNAEKPAFDRHLGPFYKKDNVQVLDIGCGAGRIAEHLVTSGVPARNITGIDIDPALLDVAKKKTPEATFIEGDVRKVVDLPQEYGLVVSHMVIDFLDQEGLQALLKGSHDALRDGGALFYMTKLPESIVNNSNVTSRPIDPESRDWFMTSSPWGGQIRNFHRPTQDILTFTEDAGFHIDAIEEVGIPPEVEKIDPKKYASYSKFGPLRLAVLAYK